MKPISVLFVCLGNICRSPLAEAAFRREAQGAGLDIAIDSAGTGDWHVGKPPDPRARAEAMRHGIDISSYRARQVNLQDFGRFSHILAADHQNLADLRAMAPPDGEAALSLLLDHVEGLEGQAVADPYFGEEDGFAETWQQVSLAAQALARKFGVQER
ncbi:MAG: low molecular weight protein-tyrosine-phosphatase [Novosphingobium sp.]|nr:low molecular weight phosphotyrosine protein phosphatase [Novosphingobium sp.]